MPVVCNKQRNKYRVSTISTCLLSASLAAFAQAPMISPSIDRPGEPFSYFSKPTDEIGVMDAQAATEITPEGYLYTGFGELMFFAGPEQTPTQQRIRTLEDGYLPILHSTYRQGGIAYTFTMFAATLNGQPDGLLVNFIRVAIKNENAQPTRAEFSTGIRYENEINTNRGVGDNRFLRPYKEKELGDYRQLGEAFDPNWEYRFEGNAFLRNGEVLYIFPQNNQEKSLTLKQAANEAPDLKPAKLPILPDTPVGIVRYGRILKSGEEETLVFKMPVVPTSSESDLKAIAAADFETYRQRIVTAWNTILDKGMQLSLPEAKAVNTFKASLIYDLIARDKIDGHYIQTVNKLHYHQFFLRDASDMVHMYDITGYPDIARQVLDFFPRWQRPDGNFISQEQEYDAWGEVLWAYGQHYRMTKDKDFAESVFPAIKHAVAWLKAARQEDPLHIMIASNVHDNEDIPGHITGYNFLALAGLRNAIIMAQELGHKEDAAQFQNEYDDYRETFLKVLDKITAQTNGYIPPTLDGKTGGQDWGNLLGTYPEHILDPSDLRITATLKTTQGKYQEGIMTYGDGRWLHHYLTIKNTLTELIRGEQQEAIRQFYALLLHTGSTHAGFEFCIRPWGDRNFESNLSPHGWFAAEYRTLVRNMLVREDRQELHLLSAISPEWIGTGKSIQVKNVPTEFGTVAFKLEEPDDSTAVLSINAQWQTTPEIVIHIPWFMQVQKATVDGKSVQVQNSQLKVSGNVKEVRLHWHRKTDAPTLNYRKAVEDYKKEYTRRYEAYMHQSEASQ